MGNTAIVIGATGLVGRALVNQLARADHIRKVITLTRRPDAHDSRVVHNQVIDFDRLGEAGDFFQGDFLFSCLGTTRKQAGSIAAQRKVDLEYQYQAAKIAAQQGVRHYLLVSSSGADAGSANPYLQMKGELETRIQKLPFERISIFQPSLLVGERPELRVGEKVGAVVLPMLCAIPGLRRYRPIRGNRWPPRWFK